MEKETKVVKNISKAYGYNYASLGDIAKQGFEIPKMKTGSEDGKEYVYCYDAELKEWIRGAEIVVPNMKNMNEAQRYGSALTYARRYSVLMQLGLVCDDDKKLETQEPEKKKSGIFDEPIPNAKELLNRNIKECANEFRKVVPKEAQEKILEHFSAKRAEDIGLVNLQRYIEGYGKEQAN